MPGSAIWNSWLTATSAASRRRARARRYPAGAAFAPRVLDVVPDGIRSQACAPSGTPAPADIPLGPRSRRGCSMSCQTGFVPKRARLQARPRPPISRWGRVRAEGARCRARRDSFPSVRAFRRARARRYPAGAAFAPKGANGVPNGIRTRVASLKGWSPDLARRWGRGFGRWLRCGPLSSHEV